MQYQNAGIYPFWSRPYNWEYSHFDLSSSSLYVWHMEFVRKLEILSYQTDLQDSVLIHFFGSLKVCIPWMINYAFDLHYTTQNRWSHLLLFYKTRSHQCFYSWNGMQLKFGSLYRSTFGIADFLCTRYDTAFQNDFLCEHFLYWTYKIMKEAQWFKNI